MKSHYFKFSFLFTIVCALIASQAIFAGHEHHGHVSGSTSAITPGTFLILLSTGFFTGLSHCAGMCGSLVSAFSIQQKQMRGTVAVPLFLYQFGRISTYLLIGLVMAALGSSLQVAALGQGWQVALSVFIGLMMFAIALSLMGAFPPQGWLESARLAKWAGERIHQMMMSKHRLAPYGLGMANGMLPCGPVYAMALLAATSQSPLHGALIMLLFGLGTLPAMLSMGFVFARLSVALRSKLYRLAAILILLVGLQQILRGLALGGLLEHFHIGNVMVW